MLTEVLTLHPFCRWYRQIFRTGTASITTSGTFQAIICSLIQVGLGLPLEVSETTSTLPNRSETTHFHSCARQPIENTLPKLQSNPTVVCLLPPGACRSHREIDLDDFETEERPQTPQGSRPTETRSDLIDVQVLAQAWDDVDQFAVCFRFPSEDNALILFL